MKVSQPEWSSPPADSTGDALHRIVRAALNVGGLPVGELFAFLVRSPFERRMRDWMDRCEMRLKHLAARDNEMFARLPASETFTSVFIAATQAAVRTHREEKLRMLAAAVLRSAQGTNVAEDIQLMFVRFVDELTPSHFVLLTVLADDEAALAQLLTFEALRQAFIVITKRQTEPAQFKLLCNDLQSRVLARFSDALEDFGGIAVTNALAAEDSGCGPKIVVTTLGHAFRRFVSESRDDQPSSDL